MSRIDRVFAKIKEYMPDFNQARLEKAFKFADEAHSKHQRKSGEPYIVHPLETARVLAGLKVDENTLIASLLHDVPEDTEYTLANVRSEFGEEVAYLVDGVTKLSKLHYQNRMEDRQIASLRKMFLVMAKDVRVVLIKLADRLHNMRTLQHVEPGKQERIARETLEIYAPLANLLGVWQLRWPLEDYCFQHLYPEEFKKIKEYLSDTQEERANYVKQLQHVLEDQLLRFEIHAKIEGRSKHLYSIYQKMLRENKSLEEIYDIFALRVIAETVDDCYRILGTVHKLWHPKAGRFKDYIAVPKPNGYRSLHTTVFGPKGKATEFQIRTKEMHLEAETGIATHLLYQSKQGRLPLESLPWVRNILDLHGLEKDNKSFIEELKLDVFQDRIFVFTPKGDAIDLPRNATCLDFAYNVHTSLGNRARKVRVNDKTVPLNSRLKLGDTVEIVGDHERIGPKREWLNYVKTSQAKRAIRNWFRNETYARKLEMGNDILKKELERMGRGPDAEISKAEKNTLLNELEYKSFEKILVAIGEGSMELEQIVDFLKPVHKDPWQWISKALDNLRFRLIKNWGDAQGKKKVNLKIVSKERIGLARDVAGAIAAMGIDIDSIQFKKSSWDRTKGVGKIKLRLNTFDELRKVCHNLEIYESVKSIVRVSLFWKIFLFSWMLTTFAVWLSHPFLLRYFVSKGVHGQVSYYSLMALGFALLFFMIFSLKYFTRRTFPSLYKQKIFWLIAFILNAFAILTIVVENQVYALGFNWIFSFTLFALLNAYLVVEYIDARNVLASDQGKTIKAPRKKIHGRFSKTN